MSYALKTYRLLNSLSVDVAAGAVICAVFLSEVLRSRPGNPALIVLGLTVWIIYSADHLLDAYRIGTEAATHRHRLYQRNFKIMLLLTAMAAIADAFLAMRIRPAVFQAGLVLAAPVGVYLIAQRFFVSVKELLGAMLYTAGVVLPAYIFMGDRSVTIDQVAFLAGFFLVAWTNLLLFSYFDSESDLKHKQPSFTTRWGLQATRRVIFTQLAIGLCICGYLSVVSMLLPAIVLFAMNVVLLALMCYREYFARTDRFRMVGDSIFLIPLVAVLA